MILAIDIGNTTVALGGIKDGRVCFVAHMDTVRTRTAAEYRAEMEKVFSHRRHPERPVRFEGHERNVPLLQQRSGQITGAVSGDLNVQWGSPLFRPGRRRGKITKYLALVYHRLLRIVS